MHACDVFKLQVCTKILHTLIKKCMHANNVQKCYRDDIQYSYSFKAMGLETLCDLHLDMYCNCYIVRMDFYLNFLILFL